MDSGKTSCIVITNSIEYRYKSYGNKLPFAFRLHAFHRQNDREHAETQDWKRAKSYSIFGISNERKA